MDALPVRNLFAGKDICGLLAESGILVVTAPPGSGKSTILPLSILDGMESGNVILLEPRRIAARQVASRLAFNLGGKVGGTVGYRVRFESCVSPQTRIEVMTEGVMVRRMLDDPILDGVSVVIFDEYHERSLYSDEALAFVRETRRLVRPDLKIVIMSATIDTARICSSLGAPLLEVTCGSFPLEIINSAADSTEESCCMDAVRAVAGIYGRSVGDILVFLPGEGEIRRCAGLLEGRLDRAMICPLYGMLPLDKQQEAIAPAPEGFRKIVLATPVAETSLTIEGVRTVVDSGFCRKMVFDPRSGLSRPETVRISADMAVQRAGRAARVAPGSCLRLWTAATGARLKPNRVPEILEADLAPLVLDLAVWGVGDASELRWVNDPPPGSLSRARGLLTALGALDNAGKITPEGRRMARFPCHPRISRMLLRAARDEGQKALAADLAAILEERDPMQPGECGTDIMLRLSELRRSASSGNPGRGWWRIAAVSRQYRSMLKVHGSDYAVPDVFCAGRLLAAAFPERTGRSIQGSPGLYMLSSGDIVTMDREDEMSACEWIVAVSASIHSGGPGKVFLAAAVRPGDLDEYASDYRNVGWNSARGVLEASMERRMGRLVLASRQITDIPDDLCSDIICKAVEKEGASLLNFSYQVRSLQKRVCTVSLWHPELGIPDISADAVLKHVPDWLPPFLGGARSRESLRKIDLVPALWSILSYDQQRAVMQIAPTHVTLPSGRSVALEYRQGAEVPVLRARLQDCFGMLDTPMVDGGKRCVLVELLSPGLKPVQLTSDMRSFWSSTYFDVRKELRRRYPKHRWPDNPLGLQVK